MHVLEISNAQGEGVGGGGGVLTSLTPLYSSVNGINKLRRGFICTYVSSKDRPLIRWTSSSLFTVVDRNLVIQSVTYLASQPVAHLVSQSVIQSVSQPAI